MTQGGDAGAKVEVTYLPSGKSVRVPAGTTLFNAAHWAGLPIESTCGGRGTCGKCKVQVLAGDVEIAPADRRWFSESELGEGWRLACEATLYTDAECFVPALMRVPKAATMGLSRFVLLEPNVHKVHLVLPEPTLEDVRSDIERLRELDATGLRALRQETRRPTVFRRQSRLTDIRPLRQSRRWWLPT